MIGITFASAALPYPRLRNDWSRLALTAEHLLAARREKDPAAIESGRMSAADAARRERVMAAIAAIWREADRANALPYPADWRAQFGAEWDEIVADLRAVAAAARAGRNTDLADCAAALAWHFEPVAAGAMPHIWFAADHVAWTARPDRAVA